jgi:hypothetical protein
VPNATAFSLADKCQYIPNGSLPVHPEQGRATVPENELP